MPFWAIILLIGAGTYLLRLSFIYLFGRMDIPETVRHALRYVPAAVLAALAAPALVYADGEVFLSVYNARLLAGLVAIAVAAYTKNVLLTIGIGMLALWGLQSVLS